MSIYMRSESDFIRFVERKILFVCVCVLRLSFLNGKPPDMSSHKKSLKLLAQ